MSWFLPRAVPGVLGAGLLLCGAAPYAVADIAADAGDAAMADFFKGTLEIDVPGGDWSAKRYMSPDHTFRMVGSDGEVRGTWEVRDGKVCVTSDGDPGPGKLKTYCNVGVGK